MARHFALTLLFLMLFRSGARASGEDCVIAAEAAKAAWLEQRAGIGDQLFTAYPEGCLIVPELPEPSTDEDKQAFVAWMDRCDLLALAEAIIAYEDVFDAWEVATDAASYKIAAERSRRFAASNPALDLVGPMEALSRAEQACGAIGGCGAD